MSPSLLGGVSLKEIMMVYHTLIWKMNAEEWLSLACDMRDPLETGDLVICPIS